MLALDGLVRLPLPRKEVVTFIQPPDEAFVDLMALLETLYSNHELEVGPLQAFSSWLQGELIVNHRVSPFKGAASAWSGLTVLVPLMPTTLDRYADYQVYSATRLKELLERIRLVKPASPGDAPLPPSGPP